MITLAHESTLFAHGIIILAHEIIIRKHDLIIHMNGTIIHVYAQIINLSTLKSSLGGGTSLTHGYINSVKGLLLRTHKLSFVCSESYFMYMDNKLLRFKYYF